MRLSTIASAILTAAGLSASPSCCRQSGGGDSTSRSPSGTEPYPQAKLDSLTLDGIAKKSKKAGFEVREEVTERTELPGVTIHRLTLDHSRWGTAFVDLYDMSRISAHSSKPAVKVGPDKSLYVSVSGTGTKSAGLLAALLAKCPLQSMKRSAIEEHFSENGWTLGNSSRVKDDITGHQIEDIAAYKGNSNATVVLFDYGRVRAVEGPSVMAHNADHLLFVDTVKRRWSKSLMALLMN